MDKYDRHIGSLLLSNSIGHKIDFDWGNYKPLFETCNPNMEGCLTQVKCGWFGHNGDDYGISEELYEEIHNDPRIHRSKFDIINDVEQAKTYEEVVNILYPYAEWQRRLRDI